MNDAAFLCFALAVVAVLFTVAYVRGLYARKGSK